MSNLSIKFSCVWLCVLFFILSEPLLAQNRFSGTVRDALTREALPGATITQINTNHGTATDADGRFQLTLLADAPAQVEVRFVGYQSRTIRVNSDRVEIIYLNSTAFMGDDVVVTGHRVDASSPVTFSNFSKEEIEAVNLGQDLPLLLEMAPSVVSTSDAGAGVGYTGIRIRGVDPTRINVTVNGIPLNDAESHGVFWVNMPDFASSVEFLQIQRGVGTSTNGQAAFGASVNIQTGSLRQDPYASVTNSYGAFNTRKHNITAGTGLLQNGWAVDARLSMIKSDGYIDRAFSDLSSYALSASRYTERSFLKLNVLSGREQTYQAWNGVPEPILRNDAAQLESYINGLFLGESDAAILQNNLGNRRFNEFTYDNQTDNYQQDHYQAHYSYRFSDEWLGNASLHYTYGRGYFEEFRTDDRLSSYGIDPISLGDEVATITRTDLIRRRWLDNHFYGMIFSTEYNPDRWKLTIGGGYNEYDGDHFGEVIWARFAGDSDIRERYYDNNGFKTDGNLYAKVNVDLSPKLIAYGDLQVRRIYYRFLGFDRNLENVTQDDELWFFNPKAGLVYNLNDNHRLYTSFGVAGKEPTRREYTRSTPDTRPSKETLYNLELGYRGEFGRGFLGINTYYMLYDDQLILTGEVNDVGAYIRTNVPNSYRLGVELEGGYTFTNWLQWSGNLTLSRNKIDSFTEFVDDFDEGGQLEITYNDTDIAFSPSAIASSQIRLSQSSFTADIMNRYVSRQYLDNRQDTAQSLDAYFLTDLRLSYEYRQVPFFRSMTATLMVNNLFNETYESNGYTFGFISGGELQRFNYYYPQAGRHVMGQVAIHF